MSLLKGLHSLFPGDTFVEGLEDADIEVSASVCFVHERWVASTERRKSLESGKKRRFEVRKKGWAKYNTLKGEP
jgi:hypothetical protein